MNEIEQILYNLGYFDSDPHKKTQIQGYVDEAVEFMKSAGVLPENMTSRRAFAVKSLWADARDKGTASDLIAKEKMITHLIVQMRR